MKTRIVWTKIWEDNWFQSLSDPAQKLFLYLITNSRINICGCYEVADRVIEFDTRIKSLPKIKQELFPKARFFDGWVYLPNAQGYGGYTGVNNGVALERELKLIPKNIKSTLFSNKEYTHPEEYIRGIDTPINHKSEISNKNREVVKESDMQEIADKYVVPLSFVRSKFDDVCNWEDEKPGRMKGRNWKLTLINWVKRDSLKIKQDYAKQNSDLAL